MDHDIEKGLALASRVHPKYAPAFERLKESERAAVALYFLPHTSQKAALEVTRPRVVKWYCPFANQRVFPSGHRYCINVYTGCEHACEYCYAAGYVDARPNCKSDFRKGLIKDLDALDTCNVPPAPVHLSNSTDPLQSLEEEYRDTLFVLEKLVERRNRFTTVTLLTKNPAMLMEQRYVSVLQRLSRLSADHPSRASFEGHDYPALRLECSLAFHNDEYRRLLDPAAPSVESRMEALRFLYENGIPIFLRIDPLFPRDPLPGGRLMDHFGLPDVQPIPDLERLIEFGREVGCRHLIYSVAKVTRRRAGGFSPVMTKIKRVYEHLGSADSLIFRGGSWRLSQAVADEFVTGPFLDLCRQRSISALPCKANLISTP